MIHTLELEKFIRATAKRADLNVKWEDTINPRTDARTMYLPRPRYGMTESEMDQLRNMVRHEVGHQLYSDMDAPKKLLGGQPTESLLGCIWNCLEDVRIDTIDSMLYQGDRELGDRTYQKIMEEIAHKVEEAGPAANEFVENLAPLFNWANDVYADVYSSSASVKPILKSLSSTDRAKELYKKFDDCKLQDVLRNICEITDKESGTKATFELAKQIYKDVYGLDPDEEIKKQKEKAEKEKKEGDGDTEGEGKAGKGDGESEVGEATEDDGTKKKGGKVKIVKYKDFLQDTIREEEATKCEGHHVDYTGYRRREQYSPATKENYKVVDTKTNSKHGYSKDNINQALSKTSTSFASQVRTALQIRDRDRYKYGTKKGKINPSSLYRITVPNSQGLEERIFKQKEVNNVLNCAVTVLVDQSGSMSGSKFYNAAAAGVILTETLSNQLHIPLEVLSFTDASCGCGMYIIKEFKEPLVSRDAMVGRFSYASEHMGGNPDGDAIMFAYDRLITRKEKRKLLIVCSDGSPAGGGRGGDIVWYTEKVIKDIEQKTPVNIVGIGIMDNNVTEFYKEHYVIQDCKELEHALLTIIDGKLK